MSRLVERVERSITERRLLRDGQSLLVAVSGGLDSMVLLHVLRQLAARHGWRLTVAHLNHQLRGRNSDADERLVTRTANALGLPLVVDRADVRRFARSRKLSLEMAARTVRHDFLARTAVRLKLPVVALAHHADDQVEHFFLRLFRGSGSDGLAGMKWRNRSPADATVDLIRPLLDQPKSALRDFARRGKITFREDATNQSVDIQRNRIRHELLPLLRERFQPALERSILRVMELVGAEAELVDELARAKLRGSVIRRRTNFSRLPVALQRRCLQLQLLANGVTPEFGLIEHLRSRPESPIVINPGRTVSCRENGELTFSSQPAQTRKADGFRAGQERVDLGNRAGERGFEETIIRWQIDSADGGRSDSWRTRKAQCEHFDAAKVGRRIVLRHWQPGDRFQPIGMESACKLQDLFTNRKVPLARRRGLIVATTEEGEVFWVEGLRIGERFKLDKSTSRRLKWTWQKRTESVAGNRESRKSGTIPQYANPIAPGKR